MGRAAGVGRRGEPGCVGSESSAMSKGGRRGDDRGLTTGWLRRGGSAPRPLLALAGHLSIVPQPRPWGQTPRGPRPPPPAIARAVTSTRRALSFGLPGEVPPSLTVIPPVAA